MITELEASGALASS